MSDSLDELENKIKKIREEIFCQENGNDSYYISPAYHQHLLELQALENEMLSLTGKIEPIVDNFQDCEPERKSMLLSLANRFGYYIADSCRELNLTDLEILNKNI